ncbi:MAG: hypothetical protein EXR98_10810 [Gemmataceae bacterium]|nr:hypothetical protein [Gemmataceae bacterium]
MQRRVLFLGAILFLVLALPVQAQQFSSALQPTGGSFSSFFGQTMTRPDFSAMSNKTMMPAPLNLGSMLPSFPNLGNTMRLRNIFSGPQAGFQMPARQVTPPSKKKKT